MDDPQILKEAKVKKVDTPYGEPSALLLCGVIDGVEVVILARHGLKHEIPPSQVNYRANLWALKNEGCDCVLATTAVGSLRQEIKPGDLVFPSQFIDFTKNRISTFFTDQVEHTPMAKPFAENLRVVLAQVSEKLSIAYHTDKTVITIEGPRFSSRAESLMFRTWGADIINMSTCPEVILANELKLPYQAIAMSTDYDCWLETEESVNFEIVLQRMAANADKVKQLLIGVITILNLTAKNSQIKKLIRTIPNWPKPGVMFRDITTVLKDRAAFKQCVDDLTERYQNQEIDMVVGIEARGFILGSALAYALGKGFVPARKRGKLPSLTQEAVYEKEYGQDSIEIHQDAILQGQKILVVDDLLATGGTALATAQLVQRLGGQIVELAFMVDLPDLGGSLKLQQAGLKIYIQTSFAGK